MVARLGLLDGAAGTWFRELESEGEFRVDFGFLLKDVVVEMGKMGQISGLLCGSHSWTYLIYETVKARGRNTDNAQVSG